MYRFVCSKKEHYPRPSHIEGYCNRLLKGQIRVEFRIGKCALTYFVITTGLSSHSRIANEEVPSPQAYESHTRTRLSSTDNLYYRIL